MRLNSEGSMVINMTKTDRGPKPRKHVVILKVYDEFTSKFTGVEVRVTVQARHAMEARLKAKLQYEWFLKGSPSFTFQDASSV